MDDASVATDVGAEDELHLGGALILCLILLFGAYAAFRDLSGSLDSDELRVASAARSARQDGSLRLGRGGAEYRRAPLATYMVAASFRLFGESETAARVPSGVFACLGVLLVFCVGRTLFTASVGLWSAGVAAVLPLFIAQARACGPFALTRFLALLSALVWFFVVERIWECAQGEGGDWRRLLRWVLSWRGAGLLLGAVLITGLALHLHGIAAMLLPGLLVYSAWLFGRDVRRLSRWRALRSPNFLLITAPALAVVVAAIASGRAPTYFVPSTVNLADWTTGVSISPRAYHWALGAQGALLYALLPLGVLVAVFACGRAGGYCAALFVVALVLMSLGLRWKAPRLLSVHMGLYVVLCGVAADAAARALAGWLPQFRLARKRGVVLGLVALAVAGATVAAGIPQRALAATSPSRNHAQREAFAYVKARRTRNDAVVARECSAALYYLGDVDYKLQGAVPLSVLPGVGEVASRRDLARAARRHRRLWVVIEKDELYLAGDPGAKTVSPEMREVLLGLEPVYVSPPREVLVFRIGAGDVADK